MCVAYAALYLVCFQPLMPYADPEAAREYQRRLVASGAKAAADRARYARCGKKPSAVARERRIFEERRPALDALKMAMGCLDCGYREHAKALQFDHVRGIKVASVPNLILGSLTRLMAEIEKCEVRCANCHMIRTYG